QAALAVTGVDALRAVAAEEVAVEDQARGFFQQRDAYFLRGAGIDRGLVDHHVPGLERGADGAACLLQRAQVGAGCVVDGRGYGDDEDVARGESCRVDRKSVV